MNDDYDPTLEEILEEEKAGEGRHPVRPEESPARMGEGEIGGSATTLDADDDVGEMMENVIGREPRLGETMADMINSAEEPNEE